jgi:hypothetical protein
MMLKSIQHPWHMAMWETWKKWRLTHFGDADAYKDEYLEKFKRETQSAYTKRYNMTYVPAHAKSAVIEVVNAITARLNDVVRSGGPRSYQRAAQGLDGGVDYCNSTMSAFVADQVVDELLAMQRVGVWVDRDPVRPEATAADALRHPYLYVYRTEDIRCWSYKKGTNELESVLLEHNDFVLDAETGMPYGPECKCWRWVRLDPATGRVMLTEEDEDGKREDFDLNLTRIPFVIFELKHAPYEHIADYQIALLQLASSDVSTAWRSNVPIYVEQYDPKGASPFVRTAQVGTNTKADGTEVKAGAAASTEAKDRERVVGAEDGIRVPKDVEMPTFINPSPDPLRVSMDKQLQMKEEIRAHLHLSIAKLDPNRASAESKEQDDSGLNTGLLAIANELARGERAIAQAWADYENSKPAAIRYPEVLTMQTDAERRAEAKDLKDQVGTAPSLKLAKEICKRIATLLVGHKVSPDALDAIHSEIDSAKAINMEHDQIIMDVEHGLVSMDFASTALRGYPAGEVEKAKQEHAERLARIAAAQGAGVPGGNAGARGLKDASADPGEGRRERAAANDTTASDKVEDRTRGEGK